MKNPIAEEEAEKFLKTMKAQDYSIIDQLRKPLPKSPCYHYFYIPKSISKYWLKF